MTRNAYFDSPFLLGFEPLERLLERTAKSAGASYPPYNIEATPDGGIALTLAVAGVAQEEIPVTVEERQVDNRGRDNRDGGKPAGPPGGQDRGRPCRSSHTGQAARRT